MDAQSLFTSSNLVRGNLNDRVASDYSSELFKQTEKVRGLYGKSLTKLMKDQGGIQNNKGLQWCAGSSNDTVFDCPVSKAGNVSEFLLIVHNPKPHNHT